MSATYRAPRYRLADDPAVAVVHLGLACCALEVESAVRGGLLEREEGHGPATHTVVLVVGTVTSALAPALLAATEGTQGSVLAIGACATSGGPYWDAPGVVPGADRLLPVSVYVPGCPPRPEAIVAAVAEVAHA